MTKLKSKQKQAFVCRT